MITAGIDCGAKNTKAVILKDGQIVGRGTVPSGFDQNAAVSESLKIALTNAGVSMDQVCSIGGTGCGVKSIRQTDLVINDIKAIAAAAHFFSPDARTVVDIGAEGGRAVRCNEKGIVVDFAVNEKCAAGAGAFIESMSRALETPLEELGNLALASDTTISINAQCTIFAESEVVGLIHAKTEKKDISKAIHDALAGRIASMIRRIGINPEVVMMGGVACNQGIVIPLKKELGIDRIYIPDFPSFGAAVGSAVIAAAETKE